jgi:AraC family transcriptional regulator
MVSPTGSSLDPDRARATAPPLFASPLVRIAGYRCSTPPGGVQEKILSSHTIVLPASGTCWVESEGQRAIADPNVFLYLNADSPFRTSHRADSEDSGHTLVVRPDLLLEAGMDQAPRDVRRPFVHLHAPSSPPVFLLKRVLLAHLGRGYPAQSLEVEEVALCVASEALSLQARVANRFRHKPGTPNAHQEWVENVKAFLGQRFADPIHLEDIAEAVGVSAFHLCRVFKASTGLSIHRYLNRLRLRIALERITDPSLNLMNLALDLGFSSHSHLSYAFRREFGSSPTAFRGVTFKSLREALWALDRLPARYRDSVSRTPSNEDVNPVIAAGAHAPRPVAG